MTNAFYGEERRNREFITEDEIDKALDFLRDNAAAAAKARAERFYVVEFRKSLKAMLMKKHPSLPIGGQEREAYADPDYLLHLEAIRQAVYEDERLHFLKEAVLAKIDAWRTSSANQRGNI